MRGAFLGTLTAVLLAAFAPREASACSCALTTPAQAFESAASVFTGAVTEIDTVDMYLVVSMRMLEVFKGIEPATLVIRTHISSATCGYPGFDVGGSYLVYAYEGGPQYGMEEGLYTNLCSRTTHLEHAEADLKWLRSRGTGISYIPIEEGNTWTYRFSPYGPEDALSVRVENVVQEDERTLFELEGLPFSMDSLFSDANGNLWRQVDGYPRVIADFSTGNDERFFAWLGDESANVRVSHGQQVEVGMGRFDECIRFDLETSESGAWTVYFAQNLGPVLISSDSGERYELDTARIDGKVVASSSDVPELPSPIEAFVQPNPFGQAATIEAHVPRPGHVRVTVHDALGRELARLMDENFAGGILRIPFEAANLPAGVYFVRITTDNNETVVSAVRQ